MKYRFRIPFRQFQPGDPVPESFDAGVIGTLLGVRKIEPVPDGAAEGKSIEAPAADKMLRPDRVATKRKGER